MKGVPRMNAAEFDYGAATDAIRVLISDFVAIDWYRACGDEERAKSAFAAHNQACHALDPKTFEFEVTIEVQRGGFDEFQVLRQRALEIGWGYDWKGALKRMSKAHSEMLGFIAEDHAPKIGPERLPQPSDLFWAFPNGGFVWNLQFDYDDRALTREQAALAHWYIGYAIGDLTVAIEWQLAERSSSLVGNPLVPLVRCLAEGYYPFSFRPDHVTLFGFNETAGTSALRS